MKIDRLKLANALIDAGIDEGKARTLASELGEAYDEAEKDMASTENVNRIIAENRTEMAKIGTQMATVGADMHKANADMQAAITRQTVWIATIVAAGVGIVIAVSRLG